MESSEDTQTETQTEADNDEIESQNYGGHVDHTQKDDEGD